MDLQNETEQHTLLDMSSNKNPHAIGSTVIYGMHGKCKVVGIETKTIGDKTLSLYKLEPIKGGIIPQKVTKRDPAIWVPVDSAASLGLRDPLSEHQLEAIQSILSNREYYYSTDDAWHTIQPKLEAAIRAEGAVGLAKAFSYLFVLKKRVTVVSSEINKFSEIVTRLLFREICDLTHETAKVAEERISKLMKQKLLPDT